MGSEKVLRVDSQKGSKVEKKSVESKPVRKRMTARAYLASLKPKKRVILTDHQEEQNMPSKPSHFNDSNLHGNIDGGNDNSNKGDEFIIEDIGTETKFVTEAFDHNIAEFSCARKNHISGEEDSGHEVENVGITITSPNDSRGDQIYLESDRETTSVKRKREPADIDSAAIRKIWERSSLVDLPSSSFCLHSHSVEICSICSKKDRFVEYWVPAQVSHVQLEQYCSILLANTASLCSLSRKDHVGALTDILVSAMKCCNHPYVVDPSLQTLLTSGLEAFEFLDVGIKASGKLQLLDAMLMQMKKQGLRVLILFKSNCGSEKGSMGDILDDFLRQRFGADSYECVEGGLLPSKKLSAVKKFNDKGSGRFVFLLERRACLSSIKLSSVDSIIIYDSDWTPMNDLRALKKITIERQFDQIKVFRLYMSCTMEEKVLMLASQNELTDTSLQNISRTTSHMLLTWGASYLFDNLEKFHKSNISCLTAATSAKESHLQDMMHDLVSILSQKDGSSGTQDLHIMLKAQTVKGSYQTDHALLGELKIPQTQESSPHRFWSQLLEGKYPRWRFCSEASHWNRKRSRKINNEFPEKSSLETKKTAKIDELVSTSDSLKAGLEGEAIDREKNDGFEISVTISPSSHKETGSEDNLLHENNATILYNETDSVKSISEDEIAVFDGEKEIGDKQKSLHNLLNPKISTLCQILQFPENVKCAVQKLLAHVINNNHISQESESILQAFQISLCWTAASWINYKISHKKSLALAKEKLNFNCKKEEAYCVYSKLRRLKNMLVCDASEKKVPEALLVHEELSVENMQNIPDIQLAPSLNLKTVAVEVNGSFEQKKEKQDDLLPEMCPEFDLAHKDELQTVEVLEKKGSEDLDDKNEAKKINDEMKLRLEKHHRMESAVIRMIYGNSPKGATKLKILENEYAKKIEEEKNQTEIHLEDHDVEHLAAKNKVQKEAQIVDESLNKQYLNGTAHEHSEYDSSSNVGEELHVDENLQELKEKVSEALETIHEEAVEGQSNVNIDTNNDDVVELDSVIAAEFELPDNIDSPSDALENAMTVNPCSLDEESRAQVSSSMSNGDNTAEILGPAIITRDSVENFLPLQPTIFTSLNSERNLLSLPDKDDTVLISSSPLYEEIINGASIERPDVEVLQELPQSIGFSSALDHVAPINEGHNASEAILIMPNEEFPLAVCSSISENLSLVDQPTLGAQIPTDNIITIPDEEILLQTREGAFAHVLNNGRDCEINLIDLTGSNYDFEINHPDNLSSQNNAQLPRCSSPLQNELDRISKEAEECIRIKDHKMAQLRSDCEKEIEEVIGRICNKYNTKLQEAEAENTLIKKKFDETHNKAWMNKLLADALRSECGDLNYSPAYQLDLTSTLPQQQHRIQQIAQRPPQPIRVPTTSASVTLPACSLRPIAHPSPMINHSTPPPNHPFIRSIYYPVCGTIRSRAPHIQPFRPSTSTSPSLPYHTTSPQGPSSFFQERAPLYPLFGPHLPVHSNSYSSASGFAMDMNQIAGVGLPNLTDAGSASSMDINLR